MKGSKIVLKVGIGQDKTRVKVPNLIGVPAADAKRILNLAGLNLGNTVFEDNDSIQYMCVRRMSPGPSSGSIKAGSDIDVWYHSNRTMDFKKEMQELLHEDSLTNVPQHFVIDTITETIETTDYEEQNEFEDDF